MGRFRQKHNLVEPSKMGFMIHQRVEWLEELVEPLKGAGGRIVDDIAVYH